MGFDFVLFPRTSSLPPSSVALFFCPYSFDQIALFEGLKVFIINSPNIDFDVNTLQSEVSSLGQWDGRSVGCGGSRGLAGVGNG